MAETVDNEAQAPGASPVKVIAGLGGALVALFAVVLIFKLAFMPQDDRYLRGCIQETAQLAGHGGARARMFRTFPWFSPNVEPRDPFFKKTWNFCKEVYGRESDSHGLYLTMRDTVEGSHTNGAAVRVISRIDKGWSESRDSEKERAVLQKAVETWDVNGHNTDVQEILEQYNTRVSDSGRAADYERIFNLRKGLFRPKDICRNRMIFEKWKISGNPEEVYRRIPCR